MNEITLLLDKFKGYIVAIAGVLYGLGLICWILYSWENHLGHVEAFQIQYLITGIIPGSVLLYFFWLIKYSKTNSDRVLKWSQDHPKILKWIKYTVQLLFTLFVLDIFVKSGVTDAIGKYISSFSATSLNISIFFILNLLIIISPLFTEIAPKKIEWKKRKEEKKLFDLFSELLDNLMVLYFLLLKGIAYIFVTGLALLMVVEYYCKLYPVLPQEIGGVKPKRTLLITEPNAFRKFDRPFIFSDSAALQSGETDTLLVYFYNDDKLIFKVEKEVQKHKADAKTFEIERSLIKSIKWLN